MSSQPRNVLSRRRDRTYSVNVEVCQEGEGLFQLVEASHPEIPQLKLEKKKKSEMCLRGFNKPEVAGGLPHHDQNHIPSRSTSWVCGGNLGHVRAAPVWTQRSQPGTEKKSFL